MATNYTGGSIVDYLKSIGQTGTYAERAKLAAQYGIQNYQGTASQNTQLLNTLRNAGGIQQTVVPSAGGQAVETQESVDRLYAEAAANNPVIKELAKGGSTVEEIIQGLSTGNLAGIYDWNGQPFSAEAQQEALTKAAEDNRLYYEALQAKETAEAEEKLARDQAEYQNYLLNSGQSFEADKAKSDQSAANQGVLFSGSRVQKERNLARAYEQDQAYNRNKIGSSMASTARDFQYKYGNDAAGSLNKYYNLGGNTFNPNVATGGVGSSSLSSIYNPSKFNFQGSQNTARAADANTRAAGYLWNKGNKLLQTGYKNQY